MRRVNPRIDIIMRNPVINNNSETYDLFSHNISKQKAEIESLSSFLAVNLSKNWIFVLSNLESWFLGGIKYG